MSIRSEQLVADLKVYSHNTETVGVQKRFRHWEEIAHWMEETEARLAILEIENRSLRQRLGELEIRTQGMIVAGEV